MSTSVHPVLTGFADVRHEIRSRGAQPRFSEHVMETVGNGAVYPAY